MMFLTFVWTLALFTFEIQAQQAVSQDNQSPDSKKADNFPPPGDNLVKTDESGDAFINDALANQRSFSLREAVEQGLANNKDIELSRNDVKMAEYKLTATKGVFDPVFRASPFYQKIRTPSRSFFESGADGAKVKSESFSGEVGVNGLSPKFGSQYLVAFSSSRETTDNTFSNFSKFYPSKLTFEIKQPLWRGRSIDEPRYRLEIAKRDFSMSDQSFRQKAIQQIAEIETAYWNLAFAYRNFQVQRDALTNARRQLESIKRNVEKGLSAPLDLVSVEAQIAKFEQNVYLALDNTEKTGNRLKNLIAKNEKDSIWQQTLLPTDFPPENKQVPDLTDAIETAFSNRPELQQIEILREKNQIEIDFRRDETRPRVDLNVGYAAEGFAGKINDAQRNPLNLLLSPFSERLNLLSQTSGLPPISFALPTTSAALSGGYRQSLDNLFKNRFGTFQAGVTIEIPFRNRRAKAELARTLVEGSSIETRREQMRQIIQLEVRNAVQGLRTAEAIIRSATAASTAAQKEYEGEQRRFNAGASSSSLFLVLERQTAFSARSKQRSRGADKFAKGCDGTESRSGNDFGCQQRRYFTTLIFKEKFKPSMKSKKIILIAGIFLAVVITGVFFLWKRPAKQTVLPVSGRIEGDDSAVASKVSGRVREIKVREGDAVQKGQTIALLDDEQINAKVEQANSNVRQTAARVRAAQQQILVLNEQLQQSELGTSQAKFDTEGRTRQAEAHVRSSRQHVLVMQEQLGQSELQVDQSKLDTEGKVRQAEAQLATAEKELTRAKADLKFARYDEKLYEDLYKSGDAPQRQYEQAKTTRETQESIVEAAQKQVEAVTGALRAISATKSNPAIASSQAEAIRKQIELARNEVDEALGELKATEALRSNPQIRLSQTASLEEQVKQAQEEVTAAQADLEQARAKLSETEADRADLEVVAPFSGTIITRAVEPGEVIVAGTPLVTLLNLEDVYLRAFVPQGESGLLKVGQKARVFFDSDPSKSVEAVLSRIDPDATFTPENTYFKDDRVKQVVGVKLKIQSQFGFAKPGMTADGEILIQNEQTVAGNGGL